jgi:repressor LexA
MSYPLQPTAEKAPVIRLPNDIRSRIGPVATVVAEAAAGIAPARLALAGVSPVGVSAPSASLPGFAPNVIHGHFTQRVPGVRTANDSASTQLPMYGRIAAGLPIDAMRDTTTRIEVPVAMLGNGEHYTLKVGGDSMIEAGILDGDTVLIRSGGVAESGQIVAALVDDSEVTLKRLRRHGNSIALEPCNVLHETHVFPAVRVKVQGIVVALLRHYM